MNRVVWHYRNDVTMDGRLWPYNFSSKNWSFRQQQKCSNSSDPSQPHQLVSAGEWELEPAEPGPPDTDLDVPHDCEAEGCERVTINISGQRFETQLRTLDRFPETLLGDQDRRNLYWDTKREEYFFDRHRPSFPAILYYYQSGGRLRRPIEVPDDVFLRELEFYNLGDDVMNSYKEKEGYMIEEVMPMPEHPLLRKIWLLVEDPDSSRVARMLAVISIVIILMSIVSFCVETLPAFERTHCVNVTHDDGTRVQTPNYRDAFFIVESICVAWFTVEFILRFISCPSTIGFAKNIMNIFDVVAILPYFVILIMVSAAGTCHGAKKSGSLIFIRVLRVFRIFKLSKHSQGLRILGLTMKTSMHELGMFFFFLIVAMVVFAAAAYHAEQDVEGSQLRSIPDAFWWAIVTMTTVGYGDVTPVGGWGKLVGAVCVIAGVLTVALPVPVVVANFNNYYRHESGRGYINT